MVCTIFYFSALQIVELHALESIFFVLFLKLVDLWRLRKDNWLEVKLAYLVNFAQFLLQISLTLLGINFVKNIFLFLGRVPR